MPQITTQELADTAVLGALLDLVRERFGTFALIDHWQQGEFHHDVLLHVDAALEMPWFVVATNCNGGVKEVLAFDAAPQRHALWHWRCPRIDEFSGTLPNMVERSITSHWFDPCELLADDARSELLPQHRERQPGGGWRQRTGSCGAKP